MRTGKQTFFFLQHYERCVRCPPKLLEAQADSRLESSRIKTYVSRSDAKARGRSHAHTTAHTQSHTRR